jgi:hypothetical protein
MMRKMKTRVGCFHMSDALRALLESRKAEHERLKKAGHIVRGRLPRQDSARFEEDGGQESRDTGPYHKADRQNHNYK